MKKPPFEKRWQEVRNYYKNSPPYSVFGGLLPRQKVFV